MKRVIVAFLTICMLASLAVFTGITAYAEVSLTEVTNLAWKDGGVATAYWSHHQEVDYYTVKVFVYYGSSLLGQETTGTTDCILDVQQEIHLIADNYKYPTVEVRFSVTPVTITESGEYILGEESDLSDSLVYTLNSGIALDTPRNIQMSEDGVVYWDDVPNSDNFDYTIQYIVGGKTYTYSHWIFKHDSALKNNNGRLAYDLMPVIKSQYTQKGLAGQTALVSVKFRACAKSGSIDYRDGVYSSYSNSISFVNEKEIITLDVPNNIHLNEDGMAYWDDVPNSDNFDYTIQYIVGGQTYTYSHWIFKHDSALKNNNGRLAYDLMPVIKSQYTQKGLAGQTALVSVKFRACAKSGSIDYRDGVYSSYSNSISFVNEKEIITLDVPNNIHLNEDGIVYWDDVPNSDNFDYTIQYIVGGQTYTYSHWIFKHDSALKNNNGRLAYDLMPVIKSQYMQKGLAGQTALVSVKFRACAKSGSIDYRDGTYSSYSNTIVYNNQKQVQGIILSPNKPILYVGNSIFLGKTISPEDAFYSVISWSTSDNTIVPVSTIGRITGLQVGTATVTAAIGAATDSVLVTVYDISSSIEDPDEQDQVTDIAGDIIDSIVDDENPEIGNTDIDEDDLPEIKEDILEGIWRGDQFFTDVVWYEETFGKYKDNWGQIRRAADDLNAQFAGAYNVEVEMYHKDDAGTDYHIGNITELPDEVTFTFDLPTGMKEVQSGYTRKYVLVRIHKNTIEPVEVTVNDDGTATAKSDSFSDFVLVYVDTKAEPVDLTGYKTLVLPTSMRCIDEEAFTGISAEVVVIPKSCTSIGYRAFADCKSLKYVVIAPDAHITIDDAAFAGTNAKILYQ